MDELAEFNAHESRVRFYGQKIARLFDKARNALVWDIHGAEYIDFLSACGALNYGHNNPVMKKAAIQYLSNDGIIAGLDLNTDAKRRFIKAFRELILEPKRLNYRLQFTGPTGTNAIEAALKLARKVTGRRTVVAFTNAFHGMSLGALAITGSSAARRVSSPLLDSVVRLPFDGYMGAGVVELDRFEAMATDPSGGIEPPAAFIIEAVQGEGGLNVASAAWLRRLAQLARTLGALLIVDDIQAGCGRTGTFFSFEHAQVVPDIVCLAKSISGSGLPMAMLLLKPEFDVWEPGEHNGTFRGNNLAFVTATAALDFWAGCDFVPAIRSHSRTISDWIKEVIDENRHTSLEMKGLGMMQGLRFPNGNLAGEVARIALENMILIETAGPNDEVVKIMPPLTIESDILETGLQRLRRAVQEALRGREAATEAA
jgi:diaminobutyrate-2-oxoglutarate transaminase